MTIQADFTFAKYEDGVLTLALSPPVPVGGWDVRLRVTKRFDSTDYLIVKSVASGFNGVSGGTVTNSGTGVFQFRVNEIDTSGLDPLNYATRVERMDSGHRTLLEQGYFIVGPN